MRNKLSIALCLLLMLSVPGIAQESPKSFSLKEAVEFAKKNNYSLANTRLDMLAAQKKVNEVTSMGLPQVNGSANIIDNLVIGSNVIVFNNTPTVIKFGTPYSSNITLQASQLLFDGTFFLGLKASREFVNISRLNVNRTEIETEMSVSKAYYQALLFEANENMMNKNIETLTKAKSDLEATYKTGFVEKIDFDRVTLQLNNLILQRDKIHDGRAISLMALKLQMGVNIHDSITLTDKLEDLYQKSTTEAVADKVILENRVEYQMLSQQLRLNHLDKKRYYMGYLPSLSAFFTHQENTFGANKFSDLYKTFYPGTAIGLSLNVPIFDGLRKTAQIQQTRINIEKTENDMRFLDNAIQQQVFMSRTNYSRSRQQIELQKKNLEMAQEIFNKTELKFKNGMSSSLELTMSQADLETARTNYLSTVYDYFLAELELKKAIGNLK